MLRSTICLPSAGITMSHPQRLEFDEDSRLPSAPGRTDPAVEKTIAVLDLAFGPNAERNYDIRLWDGTVLKGAQAPKADFCLVIRRRGALRRMLLPPSELTITYAFVSADIEIEGSVEEAIGLSDAIGARLQSVAGIAKVIPK